MNFRLIVTASVVALALVACRSGESPPGADGAWVGTITTEESVTTVVNEAGSVWGGTVKLVEDLSIGVGAGADPYMFGRIVGLDTSDDRVYVADAQRHAVRVYDFNGNHLLDFGSQGEGPGEFDSIERLAVDPAGRVLVHGSSRISVFDLDGTLLDTWPFPQAGLDQFLAIGPNGTAYVPSSWSAEGRRLSGFIAVSPEGMEERRITGPEYDNSTWRLSARGPGSARAAGIPYAPRGHWTVLASGATVAGSAESYRFEIMSPDRSLVVERYAEPVRVPADDKEWQAASLTAVMRRVQPDWEWDGPPVPDQVPPYLVFAGDRHGRIWLLRHMGFDAVIECDPDPIAIADRSPRPCHEPVFGFDVFSEEDGRFLGQVRLPGWFRSPPHFTEDAMWWAVEDEAGTIMVKRYRLVPPAEARN